MEDCMPTRHKSTPAHATIQTTVGELAAAYYEAALSTFHNELIAARVTRQMMARAVRR
jgi:hypothetical protein